MEEGQAIAHQALEDKALGAEQAGTDLFLEEDFNINPLGSTQEGIPLADELAPAGGQVHRDYFPRVRGGKGHGLFPPALVGEGSHEKVFPGQQPLSGPNEPAHKAFALFPFRTGSQDSFKLDVAVHIHHGPGLGNDRFPRVEADLDKLHVIAIDLVIDFMGLSH